MIVFEIAAGLLVAATAVVMAYAGVVGLLGILGAVRFVRCDRCGRIGVTSLREPLRSCVHCRHGHLFHPLHEWHHSHGRADVVRTMHNPAGAPDRTLHLARPGIDSAPSEHISQNGRARSLKLLRDSD